MICKNRYCFDDTCKGECTKKQTKKNPPPVKVRGSDYKLLSVN